MDTEEYYGGTYPNPPEIKEKSVSATVYVKYVLNFDVPEKWDDEQIKKYISDEFQNLDLYDEEIQEIEL